MREVIIVALLVIGAWLYVENSNKAQDLAAARTQAEHSERSKTEEDRTKAETERAKTEADKLNTATKTGAELRNQIADSQAQIADLKNQLEDAKRQLEDAKRQIADLTGKPKSWVQERIEGSKPALEATPAPAAVVRYPRGWRDVYGYWHAY
jgi:chromosome segregation ATPase